MSDYLEKLDKILAEKPIRHVNHRGNNEERPQSNRTGITWSPEHNKWWVRKSHNGKLLHLGLYTDLHHAELVLDDYLETGIKPTRKRKQQMGATTRPTLKQIRKAKNKAQQQEAFYQWYKRRRDPFLSTDYTDYYEDSYDHG